MNRISAPLAAVICTLLFTVGLLLITGSLQHKPKDYATVNYEAGYKKIGVISSEEIFSKVIIEFEGRDVFSGTIDGAISWIKARYQEGEVSMATATLKSGVSVEATAGIKWTASESNFNLTTDRLYKVSTSSAPIKPVELIAELEGLKKKAMSERVKNSTQGLTFSTAPNESFMLSKILSAIGK